MIMYIVINSYWDIETSGQATSDGGVGKLTSEMKTQSTFTDWDFVDTWYNINGDIYPFISWIVDFSANVTSGLPPLVVDFTGIVTLGFDNWLWEFGDGETSTDHNPSHTYGQGGNYTVTLTVDSLNGFKRSKVGYIQVLGEVALAADFLASPKVGSSFLTVYFTDRSSGPIENWYWSFGDGHTSIERNPVHFYRHPGVYTVSLRVYNTELQDTETKNDYIRVESEATYDIAPGTPKKAYRWGNGLVHKRKIGVEIKRIST
jgi:PKD repeat protein